MDAFEILVIILSAVLAGCLVIGFITLVYLLKVIKNIKHISDKAASLVESASDAAAIMKKAAAPTVIAKFIAEQVGKAVSSHKSKDKEE